MTETAGKETRWRNLQFSPPFSHHLWCAGESAALGSAALAIRGLICNLYLTRGAIILDLGGLPPPMTFAQLRIASEGGIFKLCLFETTSHFDMRNYAILMSAFLQRLSR